MIMYQDSDIDEIYQGLQSEINDFQNAELLITGAGGFLGRYFIALFKKFNHENPGREIRVIAIDNYVTSQRESTGATHDSSEYIQWIYGDAIIGAELPNKFSHIIHAAGIASPAHYRANPLITFEVAVNVTKALLEKCHQDNSRMIFFSSSEIYGDPFSEFIPTPESYRGNVSTLGPRACYDESKRMGETLCWIYQNYFATNVSIIRPFNIYGPGMMPSDYRVLPNFAACISKNEPLHVYGSGNQTRTFCYITDAIVGFMKVLLRSPHPDVYNVGNPKPEISMVELAALVLSITDKNHLNAEITKYPESYPEDEPNRRCPDISKIQEVLNFHPKISLEVGLARFLEWSDSNYR